MSNILKVTTPTVGYDNSINNKPSPSQQAEDLSIKNPVEANKVGRADGRTESGNNDGGKGVAYDSNFGSFVQSLRDLPKLNEIMSKMIFGGMANIVESGIGKGTAADIQAFFQMLEMSPEKLNEFLKAQMAGANRLQGPLFDVLRQIMDEATTVELKAGVLDLLKKYNDMSSGKHILENIKGTLEEIEARMFRNDRDGLERLAMRLKQHSMDANAANTRLLKEQIIPYMGKYVAENLVKNLIKADIPVKRAKVAILGFTFKENCPDTRNTKVIDIIRELEEYGIAPVISDPEADAREAGRLYGVEFADMDAIRGMDAVILAVAHEKFRALAADDIGRMYGEGRRVLLDIKGQLERSVYEAQGYLYWRL